MCSAEHTGSVKFHIREQLGTTLQGVVESPAVTLSPVWQKITVDYVTAAVGSTLYLKIIDTPAVEGEIFLVDDISILDISAYVGGSRPGPGRGAVLPGEPAKRPVEMVMTGALHAGTAEWERDPMRARLFPNPVASEATLSFRTSEAGRVQVDVFDLRGRRVRALSDVPEAPAGVHRLRLDGRDDSGSRLAPGVYFYRIHGREGLARGRFLITR